MNLVDRMLKRADEIGEDWSDHAMLLEAVNLIRTLERGECICKKCGLRKDGENAHEAGG